MIDRGAVDDHIIKNGGQADHPRAGRGDLQAAELGFVPGIRPLESSHPVFMVPGGAKGAAIGQVVELEDQPVRRVGILLGLIEVHRLTDSLLRGAGGQDGITHCSEPHLCQEAQGFPLGAAAQVVADQVKGHEGKPALPDLLRVQLSDAACGEVPRMCIRLVQSPVEGVKLLPADDAFPPDLKRLLTGNDKRDIFHNAHRVGDILALQAIAPGNRLCQFPVLIAQHKGEAVQLPAQDCLMAAQVFVDIRNAFALISGQHRPGVAHGGKALQHLAGYPLGRRRGQDGSGFPLQGCQLVIQPVIVQIRHDRGIVLVVGLVCLVNRLNEFPHSL